MHIGLLLVELYGLQERLPLPSDFLILHRDHLVEINRIIPLIILKRVLLIRKSAAAATEGLHVISGTQLEVERLQFILDLSVVLARPRHHFLVFRHVVEHVSLHW